MPTEIPSAKLWQAAQAIIPKGTHSDSRWAEPYPMYLERAKGAYLWDVDGNRWLDCKMGNGAVILGHGAEVVDQAVQEAISQGLGAGAETAWSIRAAELLHELVFGADRVRFANTGTEAVMHALMAARAKTGREQIAKTEGSYHGWYDFTFVSAWAAAGQLGPADNPSSPPGSAGLSVHAAETIVVPFNNLEATERILRGHQDQLAALILEPTLIDVGYVPVTLDYLQGVRALTQELGIVLIFDELLTGFRLPGNSAAALYQVQPDLSLYGKAIANGHIVAAMAGTADMFDMATPPAYVGTFNSHAISMAAVCATLETLADGQMLAHLDGLSEQLGQGFKRLGQQYDIPLQFQGRGGHFHLYFTPEPVTDYRTAQASSAERYTHLARQLRTDGILIAGKYLLHNAISCAHSESDITMILASAERAFQQMSKG